MRRQRTRWEEDNVPPPNVAVIIAFGLIALAIAGVTIALALT